MAFPEAGHFPMKEWVIDANEARTAGEVTREVRFPQPTMNKLSTGAIDAANDRAWDSMISDPHAALSDATSTFALAQASGYEKGLATAQLNMGWSLYYLSRLPEAYDAFLKALKRFEDVRDDLGECKALNALGVYHQAISRLDKAIEYYNRSLSVAKAAHIVDRELVAMANIGELCLELGNPKDALSYLMPVYDAMPESFNLGNRADCLRNIGKAFLQLDNLTLAREFTARSYELTTQSGDLITAAESLETLARVAATLDDTAESERRVHEGLALAEKTGNLIQRASLLSVWAAVLIDRGEPEQALQQLDESERICSSTNQKSKLYGIYEQMSRAHESLGHHADALFYYKRFAAYKAEVQNEDSASKLHNMQAQAEVERAQQEAEIYRLKNIDLKEKTEALEDLNRQILSISRIGRRITASLDYAMVVQTIYDSLVPFLEMDMFGVALYDPERGHLVYRRYFEDGVKKKDHVIDANSETSFAAWAFRNREPVLITDKEVEYKKYLTKHSTFRGRPSESVVCMPLTIEDRAIGVLTIQSYKAHAYSPNHLSFLEALAPYVAIAVENAIIHDRLEELNRALSDEKRRLERATLKISHLANHDTLTGLPNRRLLFELTGKAIETARRAGASIGVIFMDLDDFKPINDRYGHAAGDAALMAMSDRVRTLVRASDIVARMGGDEFIAVITNVKSRKDVERVARKVLSECTRPMTFSGKTCSIGLSMGISMFPDDGDSVESLINKADSAMYRVKNSAKNSFAFASSPSTGETVLD